MYFLGKRQKINTISHGSSDKGTWTGMRQSAAGMRKSSSAALIWILKIFSQERYYQMVRLIGRHSFCTENDLTSKNIMDELNLTRRQFDSKDFETYDGQTG